MILCIGPNPAIDRSIVVPNFAPFEVNRSTYSMEAAGGKSINVARAVAVLGGRATCAGFLGGETGARIARMVEGEGLESAWTWIDGETRTCIIIVEPHSGRATVVNDQGPTVAAADWDRLHADVIAAAAKASAICFSGSLPPGSPVEAFTHLLHDLAASNLPLWVDTSGAALQAVLSISNLAVKVNHEEIGMALGQVIHDAEAVGRAAASLCERRQAAVIVTLGAQGAVVALPGGQWWAQPPQVKAVSSVGSGDSFLAGWVMALNQGLPPATALRWAVAAGTANALSVGGGQFETADFEHILAETRVVSL